MKNSHSLASVFAAGPRRTQSATLGWLAAGLALFLLSSAHATLFYTEGFDYPSGPLSGNDSWLGGSSGLTVGSPSLSYPSLADVSNPGNSLLNTVVGSSGSMTVNFNSTPITSGSVYYSFLAQCTTLPIANSYLTDLLNTGGSPNGSGDPLSVYVGQQVAGSQYKIGVRHSGVGSGATYATSSSMVLNTVNFFVVKYTFGSGGSVSLFVNPTPGDAEPAADVTVAPGGTEATGLQTLGFKVNSSNQGNWVFDTLRIGDTWVDVTPAAIPEPSTFALAGLAMALALWRRKHC